MDAANGKQIVMFLDYDGTLSPIVQDPDRAFMSDSVSVSCLQQSCYCSVNLVLDYRYWLLTTCSVVVTDEKNCEETCKVFSNCYS